MSRKRKARQRLEESRKKGMLKDRIKLSQEQLALSEARLSLAAEKYENAMIALYHGGDAAQRAVMEAEYQKVAGCRLKAVYEASIIEALSKDKRAASVI